MEARIIIAWAIIAVMVGSAGLGAAVALPRYRRESLRRRGIKDERGGPRR